MMPPLSRRSFLKLATMATPVLLSSCSSGQEPTSAEPVALDSSRYLVSVVDVPETTDFQLTTIDYTIALNVFNRLVETQKMLVDGTVEIVPSLAESWEVSDDGLVYTFQLRKDVRFSNGNPLTASDVLYTFTRLLTHPLSSNQDIVSDIKGAARLASGEASELEGFRVIDDHSFEITLEQPFAAFLACLCMPGASILDEESTEAAGEAFGMDPALTIGTGSFLFADWRPGDGILLAANPDCWEGKPELEGVYLRFVDDATSLSELIDAGKIDVINVDDLGELADYYLHGETHRDHLRSAPHVGIDYIALNASVKPLDDVRVRKALQLALNRRSLLEAAYNGSGRIENGIFPFGLIGYNPELPEIPYDLAEAARLLKEAGLADGFDLQLEMRTTSTQWQRALLDMAADMWKEVNVRATINILSEDEFMNRRKAGEIPCYTASWAADYDDPDNFIYTFFGSVENTTGRSLCYQDEDVMARVRDARAIMDPDARIAEYDELERIIVQEDAAWIPLFSRERAFLVSDRVETFVTAWNGWFETSYKYMSLRSDI